MAIEVMVVAALPFAALGGATPFVVPALGFATALPFTMVLAHAIAVIVPAVAAIVPALTVTAPIVLLVVAPGRRGHGEHRDHGNETESQRFSKRDTHGFTPRGPGPPRTSLKTLTSGRAG